MNAHGFNIILSVYMFGSHFILGGLNYYVLAFKLIIWYNPLIVYMFTLNLYLKKIPASNYSCNWPIPYTVTNP